MRRRRPSPAAADRRLAACRRGAAARSPAQPRRRPRSARASGTVTGGTGGSSTATTTEVGGTGGTSTATSTEVGGTGRNVDRHDRAVDLARRDGAVGRRRLVGVRNGARQPTREGRDRGDGRCRHAPRPAPHAPLPAARLAMCSTLRTGCFRGQMARPQFRMDFVKPDRLLPPPATFRRIVTAQRGIDAGAARVAIVPRVGPAPDTLRVPVDATELGCVRWRGPVGAPVVVAVHGITANAWSFGTVAEHLKGEAALVAVDLRGRGASHDAPDPYRHPVACRRRRQSDRAPRCRAGGGRRSFDGCPRRADVRRAASRRGRRAACSSTAGRRSPVDPDKPADESLDDLLGPAIARLRKVWPDRVSYHAMWSAHPAFAEGLTPEMERYVLSDLAAVRRRVPQQRQRGSSAHRRT